MTRLLTEGISAQSQTGKIFVVFGFASQTEVDAVAARRAQDKNAGAMLSDALVAERICTKKQRALVLQVQGLLRATYKKTGELISLDDRTFIGQILVALGFVAKEDLLTVLGLQEEERAKGNETPRLGELLVDLELCSRAQRDMAMKLQNLLRGVE